ncbi:hypothetical protein CHCC14809_0105 [Bacillus licheniformis]|nr:hypothetical protein B4094_0926 [Bacillus licheniformis]TWN11078.1 hypothetical protein CHCC14564_3630 [Bacillus licheniformis LMG 17339]TWJ48624.1 hypothetical protein CHCC5025_1424 [Bacillus licheniformis]TWJ93223.1 hypothetical protein CHCC20496_0939 [Bacillus licheniformis]TWK05136.1 hypothetical protein CHCC20442_3292 [Bacillus licheniformis]
MLYLRRFFRYHAYRSFFRFSGRFYIKTKQPVQNKLKKSFL